MSHLFQVLSFSIVFLFFSCSGAKYGESYVKKPTPLPRSNNTNPNSNEQIYDTSIKQICSASSSKCVQKSEVESISSIVYDTPIAKQVQILENTSGSSDSGCCSVFSDMYDNPRSTNGISLIKPRLITIQLNTNSKILVGPWIAKVLDLATSQDSVPPPLIPNKKSSNRFMWRFSINLEAKKPNNQILESNNVNQSSFLIEEYVELTPPVPVGFFRTLLNCACCIPLPKLGTTK
ncbi:hypothetical protein [Cardinium endosymbiont of Culicoides punctatus]|uniref:hypothetical protein n=1 Tax=Cardinium endosymbiont of Culicoides punctatus TaxID=2304601 RepID=UPI001058AB26|nr:hypothetical protein [Cardinium endosymbiont of Culicoides punctatus]TDG95527.1 hypothetical protein CCPUN_02630 [Cardinium endosymbiont of Culicoides punctatus]